MAVDEKVGERANGLSAQAQTGMRPRSRSGRNQTSERRKTCRSCADVGPLCSLSNRRKKWAGVSVLTHTKPHHAVFDIDLYRPVIKVMHLSFHTQTRVQHLAGAYIPVTSLESAPEFCETPHQHVGKRLLT